MKCSIFVGFAVAIIAMLLLSSYSYSVHHKVPWIGNIIISLLIGVFWGYVHHTKDKMP